MVEDRKLNWRMACEILGCKKSKFYSLVQKGELPAYRIGNSRQGFWVWESDCLALMKSVPSPAKPLDSPG